MLTADSLLAWLRREHPGLAQAAEDAFRPAPHPLDDSVFGCSISLIGTATLLDAFPDRLLSASMARAVPKRRRSFVAGRLCAERALELLGTAAGVARGSGGEPLWPAGIDGSITHSQVAAYAAVRRSAAGFGLGIDSEMAVGPEARSAVEQLCCTVWERGQWITAADDGLSLALLFSAKEALYKAIYPRLKRYVDFLEVEVRSVDWQLGTLLLRPISGLALAQSMPAATGRFCVDAGTVHTSVVIPDAQRR